MKKLKSITQKEYENSIFKIEKLLLQARAKTITKCFNGEGHLELIRFQINDLNYTVNSNSEEVLSHLVTNNDNLTYEKAELQACRIAWKLVSNLFHAQVKLIQLRKIDISDAFNPFIETDGSEKSTKGKKDKNLND